MSRSRPSLLALIGVLVLALSACAGSDADEPTDTDTSAEGVTTEDDGTTEVAAASDEEPLRVVVTTGILGDIVTQVLDGAGAEVEVVMPPGVDPHAYAPSASDGLALREADLVVANGLELEESLLDVLEAAEEDGVAVVEVGEELDNVLEAGEGGHGHGDEDHDEHAEGEDHAEDDHDEHGDEEHDEDSDEGEDHDHGAFDPHVWLDPINVGQIAEVVAAAYAEVDAGAADTVTANATDVVADMDALDLELQQLVATLDEEQRLLVTNHDALQYLAARYGFEVIATVLPGTSTDVDVTAAGFTELVDTIRDAGVPAIFAETSSSDRLAQSLAEEVGDIEVVELYTGSLGEPGSGADSVAGIIRTDIERIVDALG